MTAFTLANRLLEPLIRPWAVVAGSLLPPDTQAWEAASSVFRLTLRLLHLVLAL